MDDVISRYEAQYIMRGLGRGEEFEHLLYHVLPTLAEEWAAKGVGVSLEHCFVRRGAACALRIDWTFFAVSSILTNVGLKIQLDYSRKMSSIIMPQDKNAM